MIKAIWEWLVSLFKSKEIGPSRQVFAPKPEGPKDFTQCHTVYCYEKRSPGSNLCKEHRFERLVIQRQRWGTPLVITAGR